MFRIAAGFLSVCTISVAFLSLLIACDNEPQTTYYGDPLSRREATAIPPSPTPFPSPTPTVSAGALETVVAMLIPEHDYSDAPDRIKAMMLIGMASLEQYEWGRDIPFVCRYKEVSGYDTASCEGEKYRKGGLSFPS